MTAFQDHIRGNQCWGCGADNPHGLQIKSDWEGDESVCHYQPSRDFAAGPPDVLNGGIIGVLIDCHSICTALMHLERMEGVDPLRWCVTAEMHIEYLRPTSLGPPVELRARVHEAKGRRITVDCVLRSEGVECARGRVVAVRVSSSWGRPRSQGE
jgi:acyl-coenzyme A thioesterase PaaI-like protein